MRPTPRFLAVTAMAGLLVAGCGSGEQGAGNGEATDAASSSPSGSSSASPSGQGSASTSSSVGPSAGSPSTPQRPSATRITAHLTGTAVRGVEPGCVGIKANGKTYQLAGDAPRELAKKGGDGKRIARVKVAGHFAQKGAASTCMMGRVFVVVKLKKL